MICGGCNRNFTDAGYSRHLGMTSRALCRALYHSRLDLSMADDPSFSGLPAEDGNPSGGTGTEIGNSSEYLRWLDHASNLTYFRWQ